MTTITRTNGTWTTTAQHKRTSKAGTNPTYLYVQARADGVPTTSAAAADVSFLTFASPVPAGARIISAHLILTSRGTWGGEKTLMLKRVIQNWQASNVTWEDSPSHTTADQKSGVLDTAPSDDVWTFDVKSHLETVANNTQAWFGWRLDTPSTYSNAIRGTGSSTPRLVVEYTTSPNKPTRLKPGSASEDIYVSTGQPTLSVESDLFTAGVSVVAMQTQLSESSDVLVSGEFVTPVWDSGEVITQTPELQISSISGAPTASEGSGYWWTARLLGSSGEWTPWADPIKFLRQDHGLLEITNPSPVPYNFVEESTPPIGWQLIGKTQKAYQVLIFDPNKPAPIWDSTKIQDTSTEITPPGGKIVENNKLYTLVVRAWDDVRRQEASSHLGNAPVYAEQRMNFTYNLSPAVTPVVDLKVVDNSPMPYVTLSWTRSTDPDYFEVARDGVVIATGLGFNEVNKDGTSYSWIDYFPPSLVPHQWEVRAVVNGETSDDNSTYSGSNNTGLAWLVDREEGVYIAISGESPVDPSLYEQGQSYEPLNSSFPVHITSALGGYRGSVSGHLCGECIGDGTTSLELQNSLLELRAHPGKLLHLLIGNISCPVVVYDINTFPEYGPRFGNTYGVTFNWHEVQI